MDQDYVAIELPTPTSISNKKNYNTYFWIFLLIGAILFVGLLLFIWYVSV